MKWYCIAARAAALICVLCTTLPRSAEAATLIFVRVAGIQGDSTYVDHEHWIDVLALGGGVTNPGSSGYSTPTFSDVSILKHIDGASPLLFLTAAQGTQVDSVDIEFVKQTGERSPAYFKMRLSGVVISGVRTNASVSDDNITEFVTLQFARIEWTWNPNDPHGTAPVHGCWDLAQGQAC